MATPAQTQVLYITYFGRPADPDGLSYWSTGDRREQPLKQTSEGFATTDEFAASITGFTNGQVIDQYYENLFGRLRGPGESYWLDQVNEGNITLAEAGYWIAMGALAQPDGSPDKVTLESKLAAADEWTAVVRSNPTYNANYNGELAVTFGVAFLQPVLGPATIPTLGETQAAVAEVPPFGTIGLMTATGSTISEGGTVTFTVETTPSLNGQFLSYTIIGANGFSAADIVGGQLSGSIQVDANGFARLSVTLATDAVVDPNETFVVQIPNVISAPAVRVLNTTVSTLSVTPDPTGVKEGQTITFLIASSGIAAGTVLTYTISGVQAEDLLGPLSGTVVVGTGGVVPSVVVQVASDLVMSEVEILEFEITDGDAIGTTSVVIKDTSNANFLTVNPDTYNFAGSADPIAFIGSTVPGGDSGFNTLQNVDSLQGGEAYDTLTADLVGGFVTAPRALYSIEQIAISSLKASSGESANVLDLVSTSEALNFPVSSLQRLVNYNSTADLTFTNIPGFGPEGLPSLFITGTNFTTTLEYQPVALEGEQTLAIDTNRAGVNGKPLAIRLLQNGVEKATINDQILVSDRQVDYDLSGFNVASVAISSPNSVDLFDRVNGNTVSINGSGIIGSFTVDLREQSGGVSIAGGSGNDELISRQESSTLAGNGGEDTLISFAGDDSIDGGAGSDKIEAGAGNNFVFGDFGDDKILTLDGNDTLFGDEGNDTVDAGGGNNSIDGCLGDDTIVALSGADSILGGEGGDSIDSGSGNDSVDGEDGKDSIYFFVGSDTVIGGLGDDFVQGGVDRADVIDGGEGLNTLQITALNADAIASTSSIDSFEVSNFNVLNISGAVGSSSDENQVNVDVFDTTSTILQVNLLEGTGSAVAAEFTLNSGATTFTINGIFQAAAKFTAFKTGLIDNSIALSAKGSGNYLNGQDFTFIGFDANTININTGSDALVTQTIDLLAIDPTGNELAHVVFAGAGAVSINQVTVATASDLLLDFTAAKSAQVRAVSVGGASTSNTVKILGSQGNDDFNGDVNSANTIVGNDGNDTIHGGSNMDSLDGGAGNDDIKSGARNDTVAGFTGNDTIDAGTGSDTVTGDEGNDRVVVGGNLSINDFYDGGAGLDTIQLTGVAGGAEYVPYPENPTLVEPLTQGYTASQLASVTAFEVVELDMPENGIQDLYNFKVNDNILTTVSLTDHTGDGYGDAYLYGEGYGDAYLYNAPSTLTTLNILDTLDEVKLFLRVNNEPALDLDDLIVNFKNGSDLGYLQLNDQESATFTIDGDVFIDAFSAVELKSLTITGVGSLNIDDPINAPDLKFLDLSGLVTSDAAAVDHLDASLSTADMVVTGPSNSTGNAGGGFDLVTGVGNDSITSLSNIFNTINSGGGDDTVLTGANADEISSGSGDDTVDTGLGDDTVKAGEGDDKVFASGGNDSVYGGAGNDTIVSGAGNDLLVGDPDNDETSKPSGDDSLNGGDGSDTLVGGLGADTIDGGAGIDTYEAGFTVSSEFPGVQNPLSTGVIVGQLINLSNLTIDANAVPLITDSKISLLLNDAQPGSTLYLYDTQPPFGSTVSDKLFNIENVVGSNGNDYIIGSGDITTAIGERNTQATQNQLDGGDGSDTYQGGFGQDTFINLLGSDTILDLGLVASPGIEDIQVGDGASTSAQLADSWKAGSNTSNNGTATVFLQGFNADISAATGTGIWYIVGTDSDESVIGSDNGDNISMAGGYDTVIAGSGSDLISGGDGDDLIEGGTDNDDMTGGAGEDVFVQNVGDSTSATSSLPVAGYYTDFISSVTFANGVDVVTGFSSLEDKLDVVGDPPSVDYLIGAKADTMTAETCYYAMGDYIDSVFTLNSSGPDVLYLHTSAVVDGSASSLGNTSIVLLGAAANFDTNIFV